jgi:hypothetical protein
MGNPAVDQRARDRLDDHGLVFDDDDDPTPTSLGSRGGSEFSEPWPGVSKFLEPCQN